MVPVTHQEERHERRLGSLQAFVGKAGGASALLYYGPKRTRHTQVLFATQSTTFLDHFDPEEVVVEREAGASSFRRLDTRRFKVTAQRRGGTGRGGGRFRNWRRDLERILGTDGNDDLRVTTLFDLYGLPQDFPGLAEHGTDADTNRRCDALQAALAETLADPRLIPYLQRHEFEALVLASLSSLEQLLDAEDDLTGLAQLEASVGEAAPEDINDGKETAPSKRLLACVPSYVETLHGPLAVAGTGLVALRACCPRFDAWVTQLEGLNPS